MNQTFYTRCNFNECSVIGDDNNLTLNVVAHIEALVESIPRMGSELLKTQCNAAFLVVEVENNHVYLLIQANHFVRIAYAAPRKVGNVDKSVNTTEVDEYAVGGDVLNRTFKDLSFFKLGNDFFLLCFKFFFDKSLVRNNHVAELLVDFNHLEFHGFANKYVVVPDRMYVDLTSGEEGFDAEDVYNHATFGAALNVTLNNFFVFKSGVNTFPAFAKACLLVRKNQLTLFVFLIFDVNFNSVANF